MTTKPKHKSRGHPARCWPSNHHGPVQPHPIWAIVHRRVSPELGQSIHCPTAVRASYGTIDPRLARCGSRECAAPGSSQPYSAEAVARLAHHRQRSGHRLESGILLLAYPRCPGAWMPDHDSARRSCGQWPGYPVLLQIHDCKPTAENIPLAISARSPPIERTLTSFRAIEVSKHSDEIDCWHGRRFGLRTL